MIYANPTIIRQLDLPLHKEFILSFGHKKVNAMVQISSNKGNLLRIPSMIAKELMLPNGIQIHGKYHKQDGLQLGPILGILVQNTLENQPQTPFGKLTIFFEEVLQIARAKGVCAYIFTLHDLNMQSGYISGWTLKNNKWKKSLFPFPHVIYNRVSSRKYEEKLLRSITQLQRTYQFIFFNHRFLNKWEVYLQLSSTPIRKIMPKTVLYKGALSIKEMLQKYPVIYLKPTNGALGQGIIRVEKKANHYRAQITRTQGSTTKEFKTYGRLFKYLKPRLVKRSYLVQEGLNLIRYQNRPIDFRILVQKDAQGKWATTSMVARIANDRHIVSNLAQGGTQSTVMETIRLADPALAKRITRKQFREYALAIAKHLESTIDGNFAEFGIDLGLDTNGRLWLLEVNAKPSKTGDAKPNEPRPSVNRLIQYVLHVSSYKVKKKKQKKSAHRSGENR